MKQGPSIASLSGAVVGAALLAVAGASTLEAQAAETLSLAESLSARAASSAGVDAEDGVASEQQWRVGGRESMKQPYGRWGHNSFFGGARSYAGPTERVVECGVCTTVVDALIKRLGDQFSRLTIAQEADMLCPRLGWAFRSGCEFVTRVNRDITADLIMKLVEPVDACKHLRMCPPDAWDIAHLSGYTEYDGGYSADGRQGARVSNGGGSLNARRFLRPHEEHARVNTVPVGGGLGYGLGPEEFGSSSSAAHGGDDQYVPVREDNRVLPPGFPSAFAAGGDPDDAYGFLPASATAHTAFEDHNEIAGGKPKGKKKKGKKGKKHDDHHHAAAAAGAAPAHPADPAHPAAAAAPAAAPAAAAAPAPAAAPPA